MQEKKRCLNCLQPMSGGQKKCPVCGYERKGYRYDPDMLRPFTVLHGQYMIGRCLGAGGFGITYAAWDEHLQIRVAVKELFIRRITLRRGDQSVYVEERDRHIFEENKKSFLNEARILATFHEKDREGIVSVKEHFEENQTAYLVMEFLDGVTLREHIAGGPASPQEITVLLEPVCHALIKLHQFGVLHQDVSPDNIMLLKDGGVKLLDFGGARKLADMEENTILNFKKGYTPIEQFLENGRTGPWTDVYALAATIYFCLTGMRPPDVRERRRGKEPERLRKKNPKVSGRREAVLLKGMEIDPAARYQTAEAFWAAWKDADRPSRLPMILGLSAAAILLAAGLTLKQMKKTGTGLFTAEDRKAAWEAEERAEGALSAEESIPGENAQEVTSTDGALSAEESALAENTEGENSPSPEESMPGKTGSGAVSAEGDLPSEETALTENAGEAPGAEASGKSGQEEGPVEPAETAALTGSLQEGDLVSGCSGTWTLSSLYDTQACWSVSSDTSLTEPEMILWEPVWDHTQQLIFQECEDQRYRIFAVKGEDGRPGDCLELEYSTRRLVLRKEADCQEQLFRLVCGGEGLYLVQCCDESVAGFDLRVDGGWQGNSLVCRPYDEFEDPSMVKWFLNPSEKSKSSVNFLSG